MYTLDFSNDTSVIQHFSIDRYIGRAIVLKSTKDSVST